MGGVRSDSISRFEFVALLVANHGYWVWRWRIRHLSSFRTAILVMGTVGVVGLIDCVDGFFCLGFGIHSIGVFVLRIDGWE